MRTATIWSKPRASMVAAVCVTVLAVPALAGDTTYTYDALGRLTRVDRADGATTIYTLDAAGNRTLVEEGGPAPGVPASITVPSSSSTGSYTVSWTAPSSGTVTAYELKESTSSSFSSQTEVYEGTSLSKALTGKTSGTYYYRVRACNGPNCSSYRTGDNGVVVTTAPAPPTNLSYVQDSMCSFRAQWTVSAGATSYTIRDQSGQFQQSVTTSPYIYSFCGASNYTGNPSDYRPKWIKACVGSACSAQVNFP